MFRVAVSSSALWPSVSAPPSAIYDSAGLPVGRTANWPSSLTADTTKPWDAPDYFGCGNYASSPLPKRSCSAPAPTGGIPFLKTWSAPALLIQLIRRPYRPVAGRPPQAASTSLLIPCQASLLRTRTILGSTFLWPCPTPPPTRVRTTTRSRWSNIRRRCTPIFRLPKCGAITSSTTPLRPASVLHTTWVRRSLRPGTGRCANYVPQSTASWIGGNLFLPVDTSIMGSGKGPDGAANPGTNLGLVTDGVRNPAWQC